VVLPLHGRGNVNGAGANGVKVTACRFPASPGDAAAWTQTVVDDSMHITHNFDVRTLEGEDELIIGGKEGLLSVEPDGAGWSKMPLAITESGNGPAFSGAGEVRFGPGPDNLVCIEPFHGPDLTLFKRRAATRTWQRRVLDSSFNQGHALACGDVLGTGRAQIIAGWREPNAAKEFGIKVYSDKDGEWTGQWVCAPNSMACEDLKVADLDADGRPEIIAAGRATKNVVIYQSAAPEN
jgi:hypothetical protein